MNKIQKVDQIKNNISFLLEKQMEDRELAGAGICITHKGETIFRKNFGYQNIEQKKPVQDDTIYRLYSMSKPIAAVAAMTLVEKGDLDLLSPVSEFLPGFRHMKVAGQAGMEEAKREILIKDLLNMTSGIVYPDCDMAGHKMDLLFTHVQKEIEEGRQIPTLDLCRLIAEQPLAFHPGEGWRYGLSTDILGGVIEAASGKTLGEYYQEELFGPLGMEDTGFFVPEEKHNRFAELYSYQEENGKHWLEPEKTRHLCLTTSLERPLFESAGAGLVSTMDDYLKFIRMLLNYGTYEDTRILGRKTIELLTSNQLNEEQLKAMQEAQQKGYGYGNFMRILLNYSDSGTSGSIGEFGWEGWSGPYFVANLEEEFSVVFMIQRCDYQNPVLIRKLRNMAYSLL